MVYNNFIIRRSGQLNRELKNKRILAELEVRSRCKPTGKVIQFRRAS